MAVRSGQLRHKITIQTVTETVNGFGEAVKSWSTFKQVFAAIEPVNGREYFGSNQYLSDVSVRIRIRYLSGVTNKMRISWNGKIYNIKDVIDPSERNGKLQLMCSEGLNDG